MMKKVLIVDNEYQFGRSLKALLHFCDIEAIYHYDAYEALDCLKIEDCDIAFVGLHMPHMGGIALTRFLQKTHPEIKTVIMTKECSVEDYAAFQSFSVKEVLYKPADINIVLRIIKKLRKEDDKGIPLYMDSCAEQIYSVSPAG